MRWLVLLLALIVACASPDSESVDSWAATGRMLAEEWRQGHVPDAYVRSTARVAIKELEKSDAPSRDEALRVWRELLASAGGAPEARTTP